MRARLNTPSPTASSRIAGPTHLPYFSSSFTVAIVIKRSSKDASLLAAAHPEAQNSSRWGVDEEPEPGGGEIWQRG